MKFCVLFAAAAALVSAQAPLQSNLLTVPPDTVVATVDNGKKITAADVQKIVESLPADAIATFKRDPKFALGNYFLTRHLGELGEKAGLANQSPTKELIENLRLQALTFAMIQHERESFQVSEDDMNKFYAANLSRYESAKVRVITIGFNPDAKGYGTSPEDLKKAAMDALAHDPKKRTEASAKTMAADLAAKARLVTDFDKLMLEASDDKAGWPAITRASAYPEEVKAAVFALKAGQVSDPVRAGSAFYIIKLDAKTAQPLSEVGALIVGEIKQNHLVKWFEQVSKQFTPLITRPDLLQGQPAAAPQQPGFQLGKP
jgi:peptidyl-prolyl cis-trans isomerase C